MASMRGMIEICSSPVGIVTILLFAGLLLSVFRKQSRSGPRMLSGGAGLLLTFVLTPVAEIVYAELEHSYPPMLLATTSVSTVVILSGYGEDMPDLPVTSKLTGEMIPRMVEGIRLYRQIPGAKLLLSGGVVRKGDPPVANLMANFAKSLGVPDQDIVVELMSTTTYENLVEVNKVIGARPFILVTSSGGMRRAMAVARKLGMTPSPAPAGVWAARYYSDGMSLPAVAWKALLDTGTPLPERLEYLQRAHHEYLGYAWYWMQGRV